MQAKLSIPYAPLCTESIRYVGYISDRTIADLVVNCISAKAEIFQMIIKQSEINCNLILVADIYNHLLSNAMINFASFMGNIYLTVGYKEQVQGILSDQNSKFSSNLRTLIE